MERNNSNSMIGVSEIHQAQKRLKNIIVETPLIENFNLSEEYGARIFLKREDMQVVRSFKIRGAYNKIYSLDSKIRQKGIVCASAGNHAQGVALSCAKLKIKGTIFMPNPTPEQKLNKVRQFGNGWVDLILVGDSFDDAYKEAKKYASQKELEFIHPFDDEKIIAGQGTIGVEILDQTSEKLDILLVAVGGGGLISGVGSCFKQLSPETKIVAVESVGAPALFESLKQGKIISLDKIDSFADGIAVKRIGDKTFKICQEVVDKSILVHEGKICSTILKLYNEEAIVVEPSGAITIAALDQLKDEIKGKNVGIIISGGNNDILRTQEISERALLYEGKKHYFIIRFPQRAGALREFLHVLGPQDDITHFEYTKKTNRVNGPALVGIELSDRDDLNNLLSRMEDKNIDYKHLNNDSLLFEMLV